METKITIDTAYLWLDLSELSDNKNCLNCFYKLRKAGLIQPYGVIPPTENPREIASIIKTYPEADKSHMYDIVSSCRNKEKRKFQIKINN